MTEDLKPCPFCGGEAEIRELDCFYYISHDKKECDVEAIETFLCESKREAIEAWNHRYEPTCQKVETLNRDGHEIGRCSNCRAWIRESNNYCSQCGCKVVD